MRYDNIKFHFLGSDEEVTLIGTVLIRDNEMVLDIQDPNGDGPYLIIGKYNGFFYEGNNTAHDLKSKVNAKWADLKDIYIGQWIEECYKYFFSFTIPL